MTTITLPAEIEGPLAEEATTTRNHSRTSRPRNAAATIRVRLWHQPTGSPPESNLADFLAGYVGLVEGSTEPLSERCGERFADGLAEEKMRESP